MGRKYEIFVISGKDLETIEFSIKSYSDVGLYVEWLENFVHTPFIHFYEICHLIDGKEISRITGSRLTQLYGQAGNLWDSEGLYAVETLKSIKEDDCMIKSCHRSISIQVTNEAIEVETFTIRTVDDIVHWCEWLEDWLDSDRITPEFCTAYYTLNGSNDPYLIVQSVGNYQGELYRFYGELFSTEGADLCEKLFEP